MSTSQDSRKKFEELLNTMRLKAAETEAATGIGESDPVNADALEQGAKAAGDLQDIDGTPAEHQDNGNGPTVQEAGDDPSDAPEVPEVAEGLSETKEVDATDDATLIKTAESMEALAGTLLHQAACEVVAQQLINHYAAAVRHIAEELQETVGLPEEDAGMLAEALASGEISEEELQEAVEQTQQIEQLAEQLDAPVEEVVAAAMELGQEMEATGVGPDEMVAKAAAIDHQIKTQARLAQLKEAFIGTKALLKQAEAEGDEFQQIRCKAYLQRIAEAVADAELPPDVDVEESAGEAADEAAGDEAAGGVEPEAAGADVTGADVTGADETGAGETGATTGEEELAADALEAELSPEDLVVIQQAIEELKDANVPEEVIQELMASEVAGEALPHVASAEDLESDPRTFGRIYIRASVLRGRELRKASTQKEKTRNT